jgi:beta-N-acetylhexosaminidase
MADHWLARTGRTLARALLGGALLLGLTGQHPLAVAASQVSLPARVSPRAALAPAPINAPTDPSAFSAAERATALLAQMSLEQKVGQLLLVYFQGPAVSPTLRTLLADCHVGGIVLFSAEGNIQSVEQVAGLIAEAQRTAIGQPGGLPLLVAVDQEGGAVARLRGGVAVPPGQMAVAAGGSPEKAAELYRINAEQLVALGVNMNLAPVLDVNTNPNNPVIGTRSFGSDPQEVAAYGLAAIGAYQAAGIIATAKHFPGHGDTDLDSHYALPVLAHSRERLDAVDLPPFRAAIAAGVDAIMTAHLLVPAIEDDPTRPATLSPAVLTGLLRQELGFEGLIVSDALGMRAITKLLPLPEAAVRAVQAGVDVLAFGGEGMSSPAAQVAIYQRLLEAARSGEISPQRLDEAVGRVLSAKARRGILDWSDSARPLADGVGNPGQSALASMANDASITLLRDEAGLLPLGPGERLLVVTRQNPTLWSVALGACPNEAQVLYMPADPTPAYRAWAVAAAEGADRVVIATSSARRWPGQAQLVQALAGPGTIALSMSGPYDVTALGGVGTVLVAYEATEGAVRAMARALCGRITPQGRLPVALDGLYPRGYRLGD